MELLSPKVISRSIMHASVTTSIEVNDPTFGVPMTKSITIITFPKKVGNNVELTVGFSLSPDAKTKYVGLQALIKSCVDNAEDVKSNLLQIVLTKEKPSSEEERVKFMKMELMGLRDWFMKEIRKPELYKRLEKYNSTAKLSPFSKAFNNFVLDRNKYTHGQLCLISNNGTFAIEYIDSRSHKTFATIDIEILLSYNACYKEIRDVIFQYNVIQQDRTKVKDQ